jgi:two-component system alkaline phosphatase synthesis response regulator PhoP
MTPRRSRAAPARENAVPAARPGRILVVDDDADIRDMISTFLVFEGYETATAENGHEAIRKALEFRPHLILLDLMMPVMDGPEFCRRRANDERIASVPVVCVSATHDAVQISQRLGITCLRKPIDWSQLTEVVAGLTRGAR